jgi:hypothetical protein
MDNARYSTTPTRSMAHLRLADIDGSAPDIFIWAEQIHVLEEPERQPL